MGNDLFQTLPGAPGHWGMVTEGRTAPLDGDPGGVLGVGRGRGRGGPACRAACAQGGQRA